MSNSLDYEINKELGECYLFMGDLEKAEEYYQKAVTDNGVHAEPYLGLATIAVQRGDLSEAMSLYKKASQIEPNDKALAGVGLVSMENGANQEAFDHFLEALKLNPENVVALYGLVQAGHTLDNIEVVVPHLENALSLDPLKHDIRYSLAGCLAHLERKDDAKAQLDRLLEQQPDHEPANELYNLLNS